MLVYVRASLMFLTLGYCQIASSQALLTRHYFDKARVSEDETAGTMTVVANDPSPLLQALTAVSSRYGWAVNWEEAPVYSRFDTFDCTDPEWRSHHPGEKGATCSSGGLFTTILPRFEGQPSPRDQKAILEKLVQDYNKSDNPGKYKVSQEDGGIAIVGVKVRGEKGTLQDVTPLLDTVLTLAPAKRNVDDTIDAILASLSSATGAKTSCLNWSSNLRQTIEVELGGHPETARRLINDALASLGRPFAYRLGFGENTYYLTTPIARKTVDMGHGSVMDQPADRQ